MPHERTYEFFKRLILNEECKDLLLAGSVFDSNARVLRIQVEGLDLPPNNGSLIANAHPLRPVLGSVGVRQQALGSHFRA